MVSQATANLAGAIILIELGSSTDAPSAGYQAREAVRRVVNRQDACAPCSHVNGSADQAWNNRWMDVSRVSALRPRWPSRGCGYDCGLLASDLNNSVQMGPYAIERLRHYLGIRYRRSQQRRPRSQDHLSDG